MATDYGQPTIHKKEDAPSETYVLSYPGQGADRLRVRVFLQSNTGEYRSQIFRSTLSEKEAGVLGSLLSAAQELMGKLDKGEY